MPTLPPPWSLAAARTGRIDLSQLVVHEQLSALERADPQALAGLGLPLDLLAELPGAVQTHSPQPFVTLAEPGYPARLRAAPYAPPVLFHEGPLELLDGPCVAIVGSRRSSTGGRRFAATLAAVLARAGVTVVSGLAWGIDAAAHAAAPGRTVAVLGQGLAAPRSGDAERRARELLAAGGALTSEFLPRHPPSRWTFPQRNRVIAGLADVTVVVEAAARSGALITARLAADLGREVWVVPGSPWTPSSLGCLALIRSGARVLTEPEELLAELDLPEVPPPPRDSLLLAMGQGASLEELSRRLERPAGELGLELTRRVLQGQLVRLPGDRYAPRSP